MKLEKLVALLQVRNHLSFIANTTRIEKSVVNMIPEMDRLFVDGLKQIDFKKELEDPQIIVKQVIGKPEVTITRDFNVDKQLPLSFTPEATEEETKEIKKALKKLDKKVVSNPLTVVKLSDNPEGQAIAIEEMKEKFAEITSEQKAETAAKDAEEIAKRVAEEKNKIKDKKGKGSFKRV